jgi:hypothetical protein
VYPCSLPDNAVALSCDRAAFGALPLGEHVADLELWVSQDAGATWRFECSLQVAGGTYKNPDGSDVERAEFYGHWMSGKDNPDRRLKTVLVAHRPLTTSVRLDTGEGTEPSGRLPPGSVAHAQSGSTGSTGATGFTQSLTIAADADRCLLAFFGVDDNEDSNPTPAATFNTTETLTAGTALHTYDIPSSGQDVHISVLKRIAPSATTADLVFSGVLTAHRVFYGWSVAYNVDQTTPLGTAGTNGSNTGETITASCTGVTDGMAFGIAFYLRSGSPTIADGGGQTARTETEGINSRVCGSVATIDGSGTLNFEWTGAGGGSTQGWVVVATPLNPAAAAGAPAFLRRPSLMGVTY